MKLILFLQLFDDMVSWNLCVKFNFNSLDRNNNSMVKIKINSNQNFQLKFLSFDW